MLPSVVFLPADSLFFPFYVFFLFFFFTPPHPKISNLLSLWNRTERVGVRFCGGALHICWVSSGPQAPACVVCLLHAAFPEHAARRCCQNHLSDASLCSHQVLLQILQRGFASQASLLLIYFYIPLTII